MFGATGMQAGSVRAAVAAVCRGAAIAGFMTLMLSACGGGGGAGGASTPASGASDTGPGGSTGNGGGSGGGSGGAPSGLTQPVVYQADQEIATIDELFMTVPGSPGAAVKLNAPLVQGGWVDDFKVMPSGQAVVYTADQNILGRYELFMVNMSNPGVSTRLSAALTPNRDVMDFVVSPDGTKVAYTADMDADDVDELYLVTVANPGAAVKLNGPLAAGGWVRDGFQFSPDSSKVLYRADQDAAGVLELYVVDVAAPGQSQKVNATLTAGGNVYGEFHFSPDGARIGYVADQMTDDMLEIFVAAANAPGVTTKVSGALIPEGDVCRFQFSPDSQRVAYCADEQADEVIELFTVSLDAPGASVKLNPTLVAGGKVSTGYVFSSDSSFIVYAAEQDQVGSNELYRVSIANPGVATKVNAPFVAGGDVGLFHVRADDSRVAYMATQDSASVWEIYEVDLAQPGVSTKLSAQMAAGGAYWFDYTESFSHIVYMADQENATTQLYDVALAQPGVSTKLNAPLVTDAHVWDYEVQP